jgi:DNA ligase (NAD+)
MTQKRIKELEEIISSLDTAFDKGDDCINPLTGEIVLDNEYDALKAELFKLKPDSKIFTTVTASKVENKGKIVSHNPPMTSINKCNGTEEDKGKILDKWFADCQKYGAILFSMSFKHDGLALSLEYENGILKRAGLRSKSGKDGIDVTDKTCYIKNIPQQLPLPLTCIIRGEIETTKTEFEKQCHILGNEAKANPRAHTAGSMNQKTAEQMKNRGLSFIAYNIINLEDPPYTTEIERAEWANRVLNLIFVKTIPFSKDKLQVFESQHRRLDFMVDGVVISVNDLSIQEKMGHTGDRDNGNPRGKIAWKFKDEIKTAIITNIDWNCGRTGVITPILNFDGIQLESTTVQKCTCHNLAMIEKYKIGIGSKVEIIKSGKIIPKLHKVIESKGEVKYPKECPSCGNPTKRVEGNNNAVSLICDSPTCPAQQVQNLDHFLKRMGVKGIAEKNIEKLCEYGLVKEPADFYKLTLESIMGIGIKERSATLILARIRMINNPEDEKDNSILIATLKAIKNKKIKVKMETFIASLGIESAGREMGRILSENYSDFNIVRNLKQEELERFDGIGPITAENVVKYFKESSSIIDNLLEFIEIIIPEKKSGNLNGKIFCLSGSLPGGKTRIKEIIESSGGKVSSSVSKKTNYLVAGEGSVGKSSQAEKLGVPIVTVEDIERML